MKKGFTVIELLVVVAVIGILATVVMTNLSSARDRAKFSRTMQELRNIALNFTIYELENEFWPGDVSPNVLPAEMSEYFDSWPEPVYPGAVYDWEHWTSGSGDPTTQVSLRFCESGTCNFPEDDWANDFVNQSAVYYCLQGDCRSWESDASVPGRCINCSE